MISQTLHNRLGDSLSKDTTVTNDITATAELADGIH